ncbi:MAG: lipid A biosynthesis acyltransferase [Lysobacterales bacterium]|nr:MAG: lipid A biosynthesis acyltransferase [Xanthomonadales bacterium]
MSSDNFWSTKFAPLRYAVGWLGYAWMRLVVCLPFRVQMAVGRALGRMAYSLLRERRRIAARNIDACLRDVPAEERARILVQHFESLGLSIVEMAMGWFGRLQAVLQRIDIEGAEHLEAALAKGKGVILFSAHFTAFEFFWPALKSLCPKLAGMYKWQRNPVMNRAMRRGRGRSYDVQIAKDNVREMLRTLRENSVFWYASDQSYGGKGSVLLPFFGEPAMTNTAIGRIAKASGAAVLPYCCRRLANGRYLMTIGAPLDGVPSGDEIADTRALTKKLEDYIRLSPEQYWWIHQRFKGRPAPLPDLYAATTS